MTTPRSLAAHGWILALLGALFLLFWTASGRVDRIETVGRLGAGAPGTPGTRSLLVPLHAQGSYEWIALTAQAQADHAWRLRDVSYDNAVEGRLSHLASPYRWWLQFVATVDAFIHGSTREQSLERAALWAAPFLQALLLIIVVAFIARGAGAWPASVVALGWIGLFPLNTQFLPGQPDDLGLKAALVLVHALCLYRAVQQSSVPRGSARRWMIGAGLAGGLGCWLQVSSQLPLIGGFLGAAVLVRWRAPQAWPDLPLRCWAACGAFVSVAAWLFEYAPSHLLPLNLSVNHPLYALAWLAAADLVASEHNDLRRPFRLLICIAAVAAPFGVAFGTGTLGFPGAAANVNQLTGVENGVAAANAGAWLARDGVTAPLAATLLAILLFAGTTVFAFRAMPRAAGWVGVVLLSGPVAIWVVLACFRLYGWTFVDAALLALLAATLSAGGAHRFRVAAGSLVLLGFLPGLWLAWPRGGSEREVTADEVEALVARDLAHTLARRAGAPDAVVIAPPALTAALIHFGGLRGVGTTYWENRDGLTAAVRIMGATSTDEALALAERREVRYLVLPSWDSTLEDLARFASEDFDKTLAGLLRQWLPPRWLRPVPYALPGIAGLETRAVMIFEVVEAQDNATALARLAEYFLEMGQPQLASPVAAALEEAFPTELSALAGRLLVEMAQRDSAAVNATITLIKAQLALKADEILPWERRVSLALALVQARQAELARPLLEFSLETADEDHLRSLTTGALYRLLAITKATGLAWPDNSLRQDALTLLPPEWLERL